MCAQFICAFFAEVVDTTLKKTTHVCMLYFIVNTHTQHRFITSACCVVNSYILSPPVFIGACNTSHGTRHTLTMTKGKHIVQHMFMLENVYNISALLCEYKHTRTSKAKRRFNDFRSVFAIAQSHNLLISRPHQPTKNICVLPTVHWHTISCAGIGEHNHRRRLARMCSTQSISVARRMGNSIYATTQSRANVSRASRSAAVVQNSVGERADINVLNSISASRTRTRTCVCYRMRCVQCYTAA